MKRILFLVLLFLCVLCFFLFKKDGLYVEDMMDSYSKVSIGYDESLLENTSLYNNQIDSLENLEESSEVILKVKFINREQIQYLSKSKCQIVEVIQNKHLIDIDIEDTIYLFETFNIIPESILLITPFSPLIEENEYYVFLNQIEEYKEKTFNLSSSAYGIFQANDIGVQFIEEASMKEDRGFTNREDAFVYFLNYEDNNEVMKQYYSIYQTIYHELKQKYK